MTIRAHNTNLNKINFKLEIKIKKLRKKLLLRGAYLPLQTVWAYKDRIKKYEHTILLNQQQVRFNLMLSLHQMEE